MIYLKDEATGVTVEDDDMLVDGAVAITIRLNGFQSMRVSEVTEERADALLRGLLRWKLETDGESSQLDALVGEVWRAWFAERRSR